jgi:hypothetical protein
VVIGGEFFLNREIRRKPDVSELFQLARRWRRAPVVVKPRGRVLSANHARMMMKRQAAYANQVLEDRLKGRGAGLLCPKTGPSIGWMHVITWKLLN